ncbi:MAG: polyprenyl synthetase family protein [Caldilineaceae bacterium]|nr:polyprenyl synthetase family protein [Caldilineaceae bacterium]
MREHNTIEDRTRVALAISSAQVAQVVTVNGLLDPVRLGLAQVEKKMKSVDSSLFSPLADAFVDLIGSGGKRLRPALALLAAELEGPIRDSRVAEQVISLGALAEMLHTATLVHDDVIDGALLRRGAPTLNASWNRAATVLAGNYMFGRAVHFAAETGSARVIKIFSQTLQTIVDGELHQLFARRDYSQEIDNYYDRIYAKTASLFAATTEAAGVLSGVAENRIGKLRQYGHNFGMAFQIMDDILDFTGSENSLGKPAGSDLRQGTLTLPFLLFLQDHSDPDAVMVRLQDGYDRVYEGDSATLDVVVSEIVAELRAGRSVVAARQVAVGFLEQARANLACFADSQQKSSMLELCDFVVQRTN